MQDLNVCWAARDLWLCQCRTRFVQYDNVFGVRKIQDLAGAFIQHIGIELVRAHQRHIAVEALANRLKTVEFPLQ